MTVGIEQGRQHFQRLFGIAHYRRVGLYHFVDFGRVDLDVDDLGLLGVARHVARHAVVEAQPDTDKYVALVGEAVGAVVAVHSQPTHVKRMIDGNRRQSQQRRGAGDTGFFQ